VQDARKAAALSLGSLFLSPSVHESYGLAIQEALQAGLPVLASDSFGAREAIPEGCGRLVSYEGGAERALGAALRELLSSPPR
jgi:glycosyltransferase involved in cell wall biosynthesis